MTEPTQAYETLESAAAELPPPIRVSATYATSYIGDTAAPGQPEQVQIELHMPVDFGNGSQLAVFVDSIVASLFRHGPSGDPDAAPSVGVQPAKPASLVDLDSLRQHVENRSATA
jgi:hypothetical protein